LPEPIASGDIPLGEIQVSIIFRVDVRNASLITLYRDPVLQTRDLE
jgi:hypothetical protein